MLADAARIAHHGALVVDQHGDVDVTPGQRRDLGAIAVGDLDDGVTAREQVEQHLHLARERAVDESIELHDLLLDPRRTVAQTISSQAMDEKYSCTLGACPRRCPRSTRSAPSRRLPVTSASRAPRRSCT